MNFSRFFSFIAAGLFFGAAANTFPVVMHIDPVSGTGETSCFASAENVMPFSAPRAVFRFLEKGVEIAVAVPHPAKSYAVSGKSDDDPLIFAGECVEIMLAPEPESGVYYHFGISPDGNVYSARKRDKSWGNDIRCSAHKDADSYSVTLFVPYTEMKTRRPVVSDSWLVNAGVTLMRENGTLFAVNMLSATSYHDPAEYGQMVFDGQTPPALKSWHCNQDRVCAVLHAPCAVSAYCIAGDKKESGKKQGDDFLFDFTLPENVATFKNRVECRFFVTGASGKDKMVRTGLAPRAEDAFFELDAFYVRQGTRAMRFSRSGKDAANLFIKRQNDVVLSLSGVAASGEIPVGELPVGRYTAELLAGNRRFVKLFFIVPDDFAPPFPDAGARFEIKDALLYLGENPVFLFGGSALPGFDLPFASAFNLGSGASCVQNGAVFLTPHPGVKRSAVYPDEKSIVENLLPAFAASYARLGGRDRTFARLAYEAQLPLRIRDDAGNVKSADSAPTYEMLYRELKKRFPERLFSIHVDHLDLVPRYIGSCDILELTSWRSSFSASPMRFLAEDMCLAKKAAAPKPVLFWFGASLPSVALRQPEILRLAVYTAMLERMSGIVFHLGHGGIPQQETRIWSLLAGINAETQCLYRDLVLGKDVPDFAQSEQKNFRLTARQYGSVIHLVAINLSEEEKLLEATTPCGEIREKFAPLEVRVFTRHLH